MNTYVAKKEEHPVISESETITKLSTHPWGKKTHQIKTDEEPFRNKQNQNKSWEQDGKIEALNKERM